MTNQGKQDPCSKPLPGYKDTVEARLSPSLKADLDSLRQHEGKLLEALAKDPKRVEAFLTDPARELKRLQIKVPAALRQRLVPHNAFEEVLKPASIRLANGQVITPKVRVRVSGGA